MKHIKDISEVLPNGPKKFMILTGRPIAVEEKMNAINDFYPITVLSSSTSTPKYLVHLTVVIQVQISV